MSDNDNLSVSFAELADDLMDYMIDSSPIDPQLGFGTNEAVLQQSSTPAAAPFYMSAFAWENHVHPSMSSLINNGAAAGANATLQLRPMSTTSHITSSTDPSTEALKKSTASSISPAHSATPPKKASKRKQKGAAGSSSSAMDDSAERRQDLKSNRIAASKCRKKQKDLQHILEERKNVLAAQHSRLKREHSQLLSEVCHMKYYIMTHANCGDERIDSWITIEALRFVDRGRCQGASV